tara:strand:+ start:136388 stop:137614 length:1227 start_codon:yes stop_codon:yes gene_type:complete
MYLAALLLLVIPVLGTHFARLGPPAPAPPGSDAHFPVSPLPGEAPPPVEPLAVQQLSPQDARAINATIPFSRAPNPAPRPFRFTGTQEDRVRAIDCLAAAQYYEAGDDPVGQKAVAQVVLNRVRHPAFPKSICAVVFQGAERETGCQFTFTCDGALARTPPSAALDRARALAGRMLSGLVDRKIGYATHYHTDWVVPYWSSSLDKITEVHTHLFFRWQGWWGTPGAFLRSVSSSEPIVPLLARLSPAHGGMDGPATDLASDDMRAPNMSLGAAELASAPQQVKSGTSHVPLAGGARLLATSPSKDAFIIQLPRDMATTQYVSIARKFCSGRAQCRVMGWRTGDGGPHIFPVPDDALWTMAFAYIHDVSSGLQRLLWNCQIVPQDNPRNCMRERVPVAKLVPSAPAASP